MKKKIKNLSKRDLNEFLSHVHMVAYLIIAVLICNVYYAIKTFCSIDIYDIGWCRGITWLLISICVYLIGISNSEHGYFIGYDEAKKENSEKNNSDNE